MAHFIRLRGAWNVERNASQALCENIKLSRRFGCSTGLKAAPRVWISIEDVSGQASVELNGSLLEKITGRRAADGDEGVRCPARFDVTTLLQPQNLLVIELTSREPIAAGDEANCLGLVQLEID